MFRSPTRKSRVVISLLAFLIGIVPLLTLAETSLAARQSELPDGCKVVLQSCDNPAHAVLSTDSGSGFKRLYLFADARGPNTFCPSSLLPVAPVERTDAVASSHVACHSGGDRAPPRIR